MNKVFLRNKKITGGRKTLYLDLYPPIIHPDTGKPTRREFLKLFIYERPKSEIDKLHNKETLQLAENIKAKRQLEIQDREFGFLSKDKLNANFIEYFKELANKRKSTNHDNWISAYHYLVKFSGGTVRFADVNEHFCNDFREYLLKAKIKGIKQKMLSQNSAHGYFNKLKATLKQAYKDGYLQKDINSKVERIKEGETERHFLNLDEMNTLAKTDCPATLLKKAALFSGLTGLRFSDIAKLTWGQVHQDKRAGTFYLQFRQKKTNGVETLPISEQAFRLLGNKKEISQKVFEGLTYSSQINHYLKDWLEKAGIKKHITFHCFRHTYATLQLNSGTDLYTVSKMLGHRSIRTTQIYAKVIDKTKQEATNKIQLDL